VTVGGSRSSLLDVPAAHHVGSVRTIKPGQRTTLLELSGDDAAARSIHLLITIDGEADVARLSAESIGRGDDQLLARAFVGMGAGGHRAELELDVLRGLGFTVSAASISVDVVNDSTAEIKVGAFASYAEVRAHTPTITRFGPSLAAAESWTIEAPAFAASVDALALDAALRIEAGLGRAADRWLYALELEPNQRDSLPLANGCSRVRITNRGPGVASPLAIFTLAL
jgi:hypothetical protein